MFVWRACCDMLPTRFLLVARRVPVDAGYPLCNAAVDSVLHFLWLCRSLVEAKAAVPFLSSLRLPAAGSFFDFILACNGSLLVHEMELLLVLLWQCWFRRNRAMHGAPLLSLEETVGWSELYLAMFQAVVAVPGVCHGLVVERWQVPMTEVVLWARSFLSDFDLANLKPSTPLVQPHLNWEAPSPSWYKLNSDATIDINQKKIVLRVMIRDWRGQVAAAFAMNPSHLLPVDCTEALAILEGLKFTASVGLSPVSVEFDASSVIAAIRSKSPPLSEVGLLVGDILKFASGFLVVNFSFRSHICNYVAHSLPKCGISCSSSCFWFEETPSCVENLAYSVLSLCL
ncbi:hypothetical protein ACOSQ4_021598 [Xanthoceras sorbifolium]